MIGHDVGLLADGGRRLNLAVEGHAPFKRGRVDADVGVRVVELLDERLHADAVAAAEEVPPGNVRLCMGNCRRQDRQRTRKGKFQ